MNNGIYVTYRVWNRVYSNFHLKSGPPRAFILSNIPTPNAY